MKSIFLTLTILVGLGFSVIQQAKAAELPPGCWTVFDGRTGGYKIVCPQESEELELGGLNGSVPPINTLENSVAARTNDPYPCVNVLTPHGLMVQCPEARKKPGQ